MKCYIIRLEENAHSCEMAKQCKEQAALFGIDAEYFRAIHGKDAEIHYEKTGIHAKRKMKKGRLGVLGCFFSHYYLWLTAIETNEPVLVLEHDGYIIKPIAEDILSSFEDVLKLDRLDPYSKSYTNMLEKEAYLDLEIQKYTNLNPKNPDKIGTGNYFKGAYAYIIKPSGAKKLVEHIKEHGHVPADQQIGDWVVDTKTTVPSLARLHPWYSIGNNINTGSLTQNLE